MNVVSAWIAGVGLLIAFSTFLASVIYRSGHISARVEELEKWRSGMRADMHEISDKMGQVAIELRELYTLFQERTSRRKNDHYDDGRSPKYIRTPEPKP